MGVVTLGHEIAGHYDRLMIDGKEDEAKDFLRGNRDSLDYLEFHYKAMQGITYIEIEMIKFIEPDFENRLERQLAMISEVSSE